MQPKLRFPAELIQAVAARYKDMTGDEEIITLRPDVQKRGYLLKTELVKVAYWKAPTSSGQVNRNSDEYVEEVTRLALRATTERARVEILRILDGVSWPTASVILHFFHADPYPIIDYRALWSVSLEAPKQYAFDFWTRYVDFCRKLAARTGLDMRTLERALWQYSKEIQ